MITATFIGISSQLKYFTPISLVSRRIKVKDGRIGGDGGEDFVNLSPCCID